MVYSYSLYESLAWELYWIAYDDELMNWPEVKITSLNLSKKHPRILLLCLTVGILCQCLHIWEIKISHKHCDIPRATMMEALLCSYSQMIFGATDFVNGAVVEDNQSMRPGKCNNWTFNKPIYMLTCFHLSLCSTVIGFHCHNWFPFCSQWLFDFCICILL